MCTVSYELETADMVPSTNRVTLRLPNEVLNVLKKEAQRKDLPLNALVTKFLYKIVSFDMNIQAMPTIMIHEFLFSKMFDDLNESKLEKIASEGPRIVKKMFAVLGLRYDLDQVISNYFETTGKYCRWYTFKHEVHHNHYRLVFETQLGPKWAKFVKTYVKSILESFVITIDDESVNDNIIVFEVTRQ